LSYEDDAVEAEEHALGLRATALRLKRVRGLLGAFNLEQPNLPMDPGESPSLPEINSPT